MTIVLKIILIIIAAVLTIGAVALIGFTGIAGYTIAVTANRSTTEVNQAADDIASFTLPDDYTSDYSFNKLGLTVASYDPNDNHSHLTLIQGPSGLGISGKTLEKMLREARPGERDRTTRLSVVETRTVTIRGEETTLVVQDGISGDGTAYRQCTAAFEGKGGPALVIFEEPITRWDDARAMEFLASIE